MDHTSTWLRSLLADAESGLGREELNEMRLDREKLMESVEGLWNGPDSTAFTILALLKQFKRDELTQNARARAGWALDDCLCCTLLERIPTMVSRALQLEPLAAGGDARPSVNVYLREGTRAYLFGLFNASVVLCRSALEQALVHKVPEVLQAHSKEEHLKKLIRAAELSKVLQGDLLRLADEARRFANNVVHGQTCKEKEASDMLSKTRRVVTELYLK